MPKSVAGRYYQLLSGHAAIAPYLKDRIGRATDGKCWWCGGGKQQTRHHLFTKCRARLPQIRKLWKEIGKVHEWKHPRAPSGKWLWKEKSTEAVLVFLKSTRVGCVCVYVFYLYLAACGLPLPLPAAAIITPYSMTDSHPQPLWVIPGPPFLLLPCLA